MINVFKTIYIKIMTLLVIIYINKQINYNKAGFLISKIIIYKKSNNKNL